MNDEAKNLSSGPRQRYLRFSVVLLLSSFFVTTALAFFLTYSVYSSTLSSIVHANNRAISFQEWRELQNGVFAGWRLIPRAKALCTFHNGILVAGNNADCSNTQPPANQLTTPRANVAASPLINPSSIPTNNFTFFDRFFGRVLAQEVSNIQVLLLPQFPISVIAALVSLLSFIPVSAFFFLTRRVLQRTVENITLDALTNKNVLASSFQIELRNKAQKILTLERDLATNSAIARTTQGLAHDIRRPFSMLKMAFEAFQSASSPAEAQESVNAVLPEVSRAMTAVEGMLQDIMQIGAESKPRLEEAFVHSIVGAAMGDVFRIFPDKNFNVEYEFQHKALLFVDTLRVARVFTNILVNGAQAIQNNGQLWIKTKDSSGFVEFRIGNKGSFIPKENLEKLFEAFFTYGKKGGTGLGLAIAQKVVAEHGGTIGCISEKNAQSPEGFVEFIFTLPSKTSAKAHSHSPEHLFTSAAEFREYAARLSKTMLSPEAAVSNEKEIALEKAVGERLRSLQSPPPPVLIVEDEAAYRNLLQNIFVKEDSCISQIPLLFAQNFTQAVSLALNKHPFLIIEDIDLGAGSKNGIEVIQALRQQGFKGNIAVHSNRFLFEDQATALAAGANTVLPKPMSKAHLLQILYSALPQSPQQSPQQTPAPETPVIGSHSQEQIKEKPIKLVYLDDGRAFTTIWKMKLKESIEIETYPNTTTFLTRCDSEHGYLESFHVIVTDYHFAESDEHTGKTLAAELRKRGYRGPIILASNGDFNENDLKPHLTAAIGKAVPSVATIRSWLHV